MRRGLGKNSKNLSRKAPLGGRKNLRGIGSGGSKNLRTALTGGELEKKAPSSLTGTGGWSSAEESLRGALHYEGRRKWHHEESVRKQWTWTALHKKQKLIRGSLQRGRGGGKERYAADVCAKAPRRQSGEKISKPPEHLSTLDGREEAGLEGKK